MNRTVMTLETLTCPSCMKKIEMAVTELPGVNRFKILFDKSKAQVIYDDSLSLSEIIETIEKTGYQVQTTE